ncbi:hypothetical protein OEZ85_013698 [Tetradesmus obliquus]|uniref:NAD(P)-binding domain-containing protein n=1 Tax=Tetradesmus obliquus TaxID=3088 RepID=A0ABY8UX20_TETOB|nr:hypothetical protein OEZ85_013698 [Tetradesmus obliquus]
MPVNVVFGAGGPTGLECVKRLLAVSTDPVRAVVRDPAAHGDKLRQAAGDATSRLQVVAGDVTDPDSLTAALADAAGVIFAASGKGYWSAAAVDSQGVKNVADAAKAAGNVSRVVLVSSMLTHPSNRLHPIRVLLNNIRWSLMDNKFKGEEALRSSGLSYTIVKPGGLTNAPGGTVQLRADVDATREVGAGSISRADVAAVCVEALTNAKASNKALSINGTKQPLAEGQGLDGEITRLFGTI